MGYYNSDYSDEETEQQAPDGFTDFDDLLEQWKHYIQTELQGFKVIKSDMYGKGCACDLQKIFESGDYTPDSIMTLMPNVKECYISCVNNEYNSLLTTFLSSFVNMTGHPMTVVDLGDDEQYFYQAFLNTANKRAVWNVWDLWRSGKNYNTK
jgi:hypothetical protein